MENYRKAISLVILAAGISIFAMIVLWKVDVWASKSNADLRALSADLDHADFLYGKTVRSMMKGQSR